MTQVTPMSVRGLPMLDPHPHLSSMWFLHKLLRGPAGTRLGRDEPRWQGEPCGGGRGAELVMPQHAAMHRRMRDRTAAALRGALEALLPQSGAAVHATLRACPSQVMNSPSDGLPSHDSARTPSPPRPTRRERSPCDSAHPPDVRPTHPAAHRVSVFILMCGCTA